MNGWGDPSIQGFGHDISIDLGETIFFKIKTDSTDYRIDIYRMGWYPGLGARLVDTVAPSVPLPQYQPEGLRDPATRLYDCGNWAVSASWTAPKDVVSGIYFARLVRQDPEPEPAPWRADHPTGFGNETVCIDGLCGGFDGRVPDAAEFALRNRVLLLRSEQSIPIDISTGIRRQSRGLRHGVPRMPGWQQAGLTALTELTDFRLTLLNLC